MSKPQSRVTVHSVILIVCIPFLFEAYVAHYHRVNKPLKIHERNSVIVRAEKLLITLFIGLSRSSSGQDDSRHSLNNNTEYQEQGSYCLTI